MNQANVEYKEALEQAGRYRMSWAGGAFTMADMIGWYSRRGFASGGSRIDGRCAEGRSQAVALTIC
jgi:hypothetical protein